MDIKKILHLIPHLGGGVGRFYSNILKESSAQYFHDFLLLEDPIDRRFLPDGSWSILKNHDQLREIIQHYDIIQIDFWNNPYLYKTLRGLDEWPNCRLLLYPHVNGLYAPSYLPSDIALTADRVAFSTEASAYSDAAKSLKGRYIFIPVGGASEFLDLKKKEHPRFQILYVGTANLEKFRPESLRWSIQLYRQLPEIHFVFCTQDSPEHLKCFIPSDCLDGFEFYESVAQIEEFYASSDVFGYPLQPRHYGTGEQVLLEAMASGVVPVVMDNPVERHIVNDGLTGIIARDGEEYKSAIKFLFENRTTLGQLAANCKQEITSNKTAKKTTSKFEMIFDELISGNKKPHSCKFERYSIFELFLMSQGRDAKVFQDLIEGHNLDFCKWRLNRMYVQKHLSKGTIFHWAKCFPDVEEFALIIESMVP
jgi:glycosyltransferase involved in cell wall biosynthesis